MAYIMAPKEESEITTVKKACQASQDLFTKFLKEQIMDIVDKDKVRTMTRAGVCANPPVIARKNVFLLAFKGV